MHEVPTVILSVNVLDDERETAALGGRTAYLKRRTDPVAIAGEAGRYLLIVFEYRGSQIHGVIFGARAGTLLSPRRGSCRAAAPVFRRGREISTGWRFLPPLSSLPILRYMHRERW